ncbi:MAG: Dabb family protein [Dehalococcoidia bacterium]
MIRRTMLFKLRDGVSNEEAARLEGLIGRTPAEIQGVTRGSLGRNLDPRNLYSHVWDMDLAGPEAVQAYGPHPYHVDTLIPFFSPKSPTGIVEKLDYAYYTSIATGARPIGAQGLIRRVMLFQVSSAATKQQVSEVEERMMELPKRVSTIVNWALNRTTDDRMPNPWTHVFELEFADKAGLDVYSKDSFHLDVVAPYFRPDSATRVVDAISIGWYQAEAPFIVPD